MGEVALADGPHYDSRLHGADLCDLDLHLAVRMLGRKREVARHATRLETPLDEHVRERAGGGGRTVRRRARDLVGQLAQRAAMIGRRLDRLLAI